MTSKAHLSLMDAKHHEGFLLRTIEPSQQESLILCFYQRLHRFSLKLLSQQWVSMAIQIESCLAYLYLTWWEKLFLSDFLTYDFTTASVMILHQLFE